jgi:hypothetical protein
MRRILGVFVLLSTLLLSGCASDIRSQTLLKTLNAYANVVRWGDFANAEQFVDPALRAEHPLTPIELSRYKQYRVSDYDDPAAPVVVGENEVRQVVRIGIINVNTQAERTLVDQQTWRYDPDKRLWWLVSGLPDVSRAR